MVAVVMAVVAAGAKVHAQARSAPEWTTQGADAQRSSWIAADPFISIDSVPRIQFLWKLKLDNESRQSNALTAPVALGNLFTFRGFKSLVFVAGSSNNVYAIDYDFGTLFWNTHINYASGTHEFAGSPRCPGGTTAGLTRATSLTPATTLSFFGFARPPRPARGEVGEPGKGSPRMSPAPPQPPPASRGSDTPARDAAPPARAGGAQEGAGRSPAPVFTPTSLFALPADGIVRALNPHTGDLAAAPAMLMPANATATGLIWANGMLYAATKNSCGSAPEAIWAMNWDAEKLPAGAVGRQVTSWKSDGSPIGGFAIAANGTVFVATGAGPSTYANSIVALDPKTLGVKNWFSQPGAAFESSPTVFAEGGKTYVAATAQDGRLFVLDAAAPGGADHKTPLAVGPPMSGRRFGAESPATWRDPQGTRWILTPATNAVVAFKFTPAGSTAAVTQGWVSRDLVAPRTPAIVNGVVFALSSGQSGGAPAVLYVLDPSTGKDLWNSGKTITSFATAGLAAGTAQVYVVTFDNTVWSFGIPIAY
jgi:outer membrane protein assembly factor BamB